MCLSVCLKQPFYNSCLRENSLNIWVLASGVCPSLLKLSILPEVAEFRSEELWRAAELFRLIKNNLLFSHWKYFSVSPNNSTFPSRKQNTELETVWISREVFFGKRRKSKHEGILTFLRVFEAVICGLFNSRCVLAVEYSRMYLSVLESFSQGLVLKCCFY